MKGKKKIRYCCWLTKAGKTRHIRLYSVWGAMKQRCLSKRTRYYKNYGGRGITVCSEWMSFMTFREWALAAGYRRGLTLDRADNNGNYEPGNCRWATWKEQARNRRAKQGKSIFEINNERIVFRLFGLDCCGHLLCWVNPRYPSFCPNCGEHIYPMCKSQVVINDENAHIKFHSTAPLQLNPNERIQQEDG